MYKEVIFFDCWGTLLRSGTRGVDLIPGAQELLNLTSGYRLGVLCHPGPRRYRHDLIRTLEAACLDLRFHRDLIVSLSDLPVPPTDQRAFAVAAALAEMPLGQCRYVSASLSMRNSAAAAGMQAVAPEEFRRSVAQGRPQPRMEAPSGTAGLLSVVEADVGAHLGPNLLAGEVDEDTGPTFALRGRVVTMNESNEVIKDGRVIVRRGKILEVAKASAPMPQGLGTLAVVETRATIYPGLIDLHNHFAYNVLPLWVVPLRDNGKPFEDRGQWPGHKEYKPFVTAPLSLLATYSPTAEAIVRYVETKAIIGGTTTGQGIRGKSGTKNTPAMYRGAMRNVEETNDPRLPEARTMVPDLQKSAERIEDFRRALREQEELGAAYFYHLAEGGVQTARKHYLLLQQHDLLRRPLVGIHSLGLEPNDLGTLAERGAKVVWSPYSNMLLYRKSLNLKALKESGALFSLGCDWTPTGSKNLLFELKVARFLARQHPAAGLTSEDLVRAVTSRAAAVAGWEKQLGAIRKGAMADLLVIAGQGGDPYDHLVDATEPSVRLVVIHGVPRYGDKGLMESVPADPAHPAEGLKVGSKSKLLNTFTPSSQINHLSLKAARDRLEEAMNDLPAFREKVSNTFSLMAEHEQGFTLMLDNEFNDAEGVPAVVMDSASLLAAEQVDLPKKIELDALFPGKSGDYWDRVEKQPNLSMELKKELQDAYS